MRQTVILFLIAIAQVFPQTKAFASRSAQRLPHRLWERARASNAGGEYDDVQSKQFNFYNMENGMCPYAARTWITLLELGLPFEAIGINPMAKEEWFLKINPKNNVPAIENVLDGTVLYESAICNEYLSDFARENDDAVPSEGQKMWKLMPIGSSDRAALRLLNDHVDTDLFPAQFTFLMNKDSEKDKDMIQALERALKVLQDHLSIRGGPYLMGKEFSLADIHVLPFFLRLVVSLKHFKRYEIPKDQFSPLLRWFGLCSKRESVKAASKSEKQIIGVYQKFVDVEYKFGGLNKN